MNLKSRLRLLQARIAFWKVQKQRFFECSDEIVAESCGI